MAFELQTVVPWGRNLQEYTRMFNLSDLDKQKRIISFGDGPASFNVEMTKRGNSVTSIDPLYRFSKDAIAKRIRETSETVIEQLKKNLDNFIWEEFSSVDELKENRLLAMNTFLEDFDKGKTENRFINHEMPHKLAFNAKSFDIGLSSHFLILYSQLGLAFHIASITEMLRLCNEIRIFPLQNLNAQKSEVLDGIFDHFEKMHLVEKIEVPYEFQKGGNKMLIIR